MQSVQQYDLDVDVVVIGGGTGGPMAAVKAITAKPQAALPDADRRADMTEKFDQLWLTLGCRQNCVN